MTDKGLNRFDEYDVRCVATSVRLGSRVHFFFLITWGGSKICTSGTIPNSQRKPTEINKTDPVAKVKFCGTGATNFTSCTILIIDDILMTLFLLFTDAFSETFEYLLSWVRQNSREIWTLPYWFWAHAICVSKLQIYIHMCRRKI